MPVLALLLVVALAATLPPTLHSGFDTRFVAESATNRVPKPGEPGPHPLERVAVPALGVQAVLDERVRALGAGDRQAWLAVVWPAAPEAFKEAQARLFDGLRSVAFERYQLVLDDDETLDLGEAVADRYPGLEAALPPVRQRLRIEGVDDRDDVSTLWLTFVRDADRWYLAADDDLSAVGLDTERGLWDAGPVEVATRGAVTVLHHRDTRSRVPELLAVTNEAIAALRERWPGEWSERALVLLPSTQDELRRMMQTTLDLDKFVAFVTYEIDRADGWEPAAPRVVVQDANLRRYSRGGKVETLLHEMVHAASAHLAGPFQPTWVHEGLAEWVAKGAIPERTRLEGGLPRDHEFVSGAQTAILGAYGRSTTIMARLASEYGTDVPFELFRELGSRRVVAGDTAYHVDEALRAVVGTDAAGLVSSLSR